MPISNGAASVSTPSESTPSESTSSETSTGLRFSTPEQRASLPGVSVHPVLDDSSKDIVWGNIPFHDLVRWVNMTYDKSILYRKNLFKVPSGRAGKDFITELTFWLRQFNQSTKLNRVALKIFLMLPTLLLQKPSAKSKAKDHSTALDRRLKLWRASNLCELVQEVDMIQSRFKTPKKSDPGIDNLSKRFSKLMLEGKVSAALKMLDQTSTSGMLTLTDEVMQQLHQKHPEPSPIEGSPLLMGPLLPVPDCFFDAIDEQTILKSAMDTRGSSGPAGMDAEQYRRVLCSKNFNQSGKSLREELAMFTRNLATQHYDPVLLEAYVACRLIPLDKNPGIRPIGIGEVVRRIVGKTLSRLCSQNVKEAAGPLQTCAGHGAGAEAAIHAMRTIFESEGSEAVLLIDASNAFNCLNRSVALHNIQFTCPTLATYLINTYRHPAKLFVAGGKTILSREGTTQGDPMAMPWYSLSTTILIDALHESVPEVKQVWLADDASAAGSLVSLRNWFDKLEREGKHHGYLVNGSKSWLIVKTPELELLAKEIFGDSVNITSEGKRHLGAVIGSEEYKKVFCEEKVNSWVRELTTLCEIAETHPHVAYSAYTKGYRSKFTYFLRTIENFDTFVEPVDKLISERLIPELFGFDTPLNNLRELFCLNPSDGGLGIPLLSAEAQNQHASSRLITSPHVESIIDQDAVMRETCSDGKTIAELKKQHLTNKHQLKNETLERVDASLTPSTLAFVNQARDKCASSWLNALPIEEMDFVLNKEEFRDSLRLRYNLGLDKLPSFCPCGEIFDVTHALSCKKGGFVAERHDNVKNTLTTLLSKVCVDVESEPHLAPITREQFSYRTANTSDEARLDIKAKGFWRRGQTAFFDIRVTHVNSLTQKHQSTASIFRHHEMSKKREYMQRVLDVENGSFTPLVFGTNGGLGRECENFLSALASKISDKTDEIYSETITWIRTRLSFEILRAALICVRGSRVPFRKRNDQEMRDFNLMNLQGGIRVG